jgi:hypothetical protein
MTGQRVMVWMIGVGTRLSRILGALRALPRRTEILHEAAKVRIFDNIYKI